MSNNVMYFYSKNTHLGIGFHLCNYHLQHTQHIPFDNNL